MTNIFLYIEKNILILFFMRGTISFFLYLFNLIINFMFLYEIQLNKIICIFSHEYYY
jgi:hypothetical protein